MEELKMEEFFKSEEHKIIFALLYTDTDLREKLLNISIDLYIDEVKAKEWRNELLKKIHPDSCKIDGASDAMKKLNLLYSRMNGKVNIEENGDVDEQK